MKKFLILLITVGICTLFAQNTLKVATYNIQGMKPGTEPVTRIQHITNKFIELDPDIIGLQEINEDKSGDNSDNQAIIIANALSNYFSIPYNYYYQKTHDAWDNQFNPSTKISFQLTETGFTSLKVFDILGNEVAILINDELQQGNHEFDINATNLTNGVYFYKLSQGDNLIIKKMLLVK